MSLSTTPPKGTYDWDPNELKIRQYIFNTWRQVCLSYGFKEYLTPLVEYADIYRAKSGEDVGGSELTTFVDRAGRELAIRPEMTPSVTRMVASNYNSMQKPIKYFSIANFFRNEKPQRGRNREFWQLNYDIFGDESVGADLEVLQIAVEIMLKFNPPKDSFVVYLNNRKLVDEVLNNTLKKNADKKEVIRTLDKLTKLNEGQVKQKLIQLGVKEESVNNLYKIFTTNDEQLFIQSNPKIEQSEGFIQIKNLLSLLSNLGYKDYVKFKPGLMRGFDYYDGMVFEVFDLHKDNQRAMFGGGRYNGLASLFGVNDFAAVGGAPGDETTKLFLQSWDLIKNITSSEKTYYLPVLDDSLLVKTLNLASNLRSQGKMVIQNTSKQQLSKALDTANKKNYDFVVIYGEYEENDGIYKVKNMNTGSEETFNY